MRARDSRRATETIVTRRQAVLASIGIAGLAAAAAACAPAAAPPPSGPAPTTAAAPASPAAAPKPAATAPPAAAPKAASTAPAVSKRTFTPADVKLACSTSTRVESARLVGDKMGFFQEFGISLEALQISGTPDILRAIINNEATFASTEVQTTLAAIEAGTAVKLLGNQEGKLGHIIFVRPEIKTLKDFEGKAIGSTAPGGLIDNIEREILSNAGVDLSKVEFVSLRGSAGVYQAIVANKVAGGAATDAFLATAARDGLVPLVKTWEALPNFISSAFAATDQGIRERRDLIVRTLAGYAKTFRFLATPASKDVWVDVATNELKQERDQAETAWNGAFEAKVYAPDLALPPASIEYLQKGNIEGGRQRAPLPMDRIMDPTLVRDALALL